jgi:hypothetical protein
LAEFSGELIEKAWIRSGGRCECVSTTHNHVGKCYKMLLKSYRRDRKSEFGWEAHSISGLYLDSLSDCEILCLESCLKPALQPSGAVTKEADI